MEPVCSWPRVPLTFVECRTMNQAAYDAAYRAVLAQLRDSREERQLKPVRRVPRPSWAIRLEKERRARRITAA